LPRSLPLQQPFRTKPAHPASPCKTQSAFAYFSLLLFPRTRDEQTPYAFNKVKAAKILILIASFALLAAMLLPGFLRPKNRALATDVMQQSRMIEAAMGQYAIKYAKEPLI
jgi:hypothetical protein